MNTLTIGKVAKQTETGIETIRYYEREGLISPPQRTQSNYRIYQNCVIPQLRFIKHAKALGFTLKEIKELLILRENPEAQKKDVKEQIEVKLESVRKKIADLQRIEKILQSLDNCCDGQGSSADCPILQALEEAPEDGLDTTESCCHSQP